MDHASRAANRHVLRLKPTNQRFHPALVWRRLPLHAGSDPVAKDTLAIAWTVSPSQVSMVSDLPATKAIAGGVLCCTSLVQQH
eukprot:4866770-Amphidinium_carterae.1